MSAVHSYGTHMRGGEIRIMRVNASSLACIIEITVYTNTSSEIKFGEGILDFGDGTTFTTPTIENTRRPDVFPTLGMVTYAINHTYSAPGKYRVSYAEPNLALGILNMTNSVETRFQIQSEIVLDATGLVSSPTFLTMPIFICPARRTYSFSTAVIEFDSPNEFQYDYELVTNPSPIKDFRIPENLKIDKSTGVVTWDTKLDGQYVAGMIWIVIKVNKYTKDGRYLGYVWRATQIIVEDSSSRLELTNSLSTSDGRVLVTEGKEKKVKVFLAENSSVVINKFDVYYNQSIKDNIKVEEYDSTAGDRNVRVAVLTLKATSNMVSDLPYPITLRGNANYRADATFLWMTKDAPLPPPPIVTGVLEGRVVNVYPNPFWSELYVEGEGFTEVMFTDVMGREVMRSRIFKDEAVNTSGLERGVYLLKMVGEEGEIRRVKVVRE